MKNDLLGTRMKENYENRTRSLLPRRTYTIIRLDGKAFHNFTKGFDRPFDYDLMAIMDKTTIELCKSIQGVKFAFTQSDEISLVLTDFETEKTDAWFDGNIQKIVSVSASIATAAFNRELHKQYLKDNTDKTHPDYPASGNKYRQGDWAGLKMAHFDSRVFTIPDRTEVFNYLIWRQQDATRNSIQMAAQALYSHKELHGKNTSDLQEMMFQKGVNWNDYPSAAKRGRAIVKEVFIENVNEAVSISDEHPKIPTLRSRWLALTGMDNLRETPIFTQAVYFLKQAIPTLDKETT